MELTADMRSWIATALDRCGRSATGAVEVERAKPWALVCRVESDAGRTWAKMPHPAFGYEGSLAMALGELAKDAVHVPLVVDDRGWFLSDDGGATYTDHQDGATSLRTYTQIVAASMADPDHLLAAGAPDRRPVRLRAVWTALVGAVGDPEVRDRLHGAGAPFDRALDQLDDDGRIGICNTDIRPSHAFVGPPARIFDWGDATVGHPLCCLGIVRNYSRDERVQQRLIATHWPDERAELLTAAGIVESVLRADVWRRDPPGARELHPGMIDFWMADALDQMDV